MDRFETILSNYLRRIDTEMDLRRLILGIQLNKREEIPILIHHKAEYEISEMFFEICGRQKRIRRINGNIKH